MKKRTRRSKSPEIKKATMLKKSLTVKRHKGKENPTDIVYSVFGDEDTYFVILNYPMEVNENHLFCYPRPSQCRRKRVWVKLDGKLKLKTILVVRSPKGVLQEYITKRSILDDGKVVSFRDAFPVLEDDDSLTEFGAQVVHHYAKYWQGERRMVNLERGWPELGKYFKDIRDDEETASIYGVLDEEYFEELLPWTAGRQKSRPWRGI